MKSDANAKVFICLQGTIGIQRHLIIISESIM